MVTVDFDFEAVDDVIFSSTEGGIAVDSTAGRIFLEAANQMRVATQGIDSGIYFHAFDTINMNGGLNLDTAELAGNNRFVIEAEDFLAQAGSDLVFRVGGPGGKDDLGAEFISNQAITMGGATETITSESIRYHATDDISINAGAVSLTGGDEIVFKVEGFATGNNDELMVTSAGSSTFTAADGFLFQADGVFSASGADLTLNAGTNDLRQISSGDVVVTNTGLAGTYSATSGEMRFIAEDSGIHFPATDATRTITVGTTLSIQSGLDETSNSVNFVGSLGSAPDPTVTFNVAGDIFNDLHNNYLSETSVATVINAGVDIDFIARKGSQLYNSVTLDAFLQNEQLSPAETHVFSTTGGIDMEAHYFIRHRQHQFLDFFVGRGQTSHSRPSAPQQRTSFDMTAITLRQACVCTGSVNCANVACPETYNRVLQMQRALLDMGLLRF
eukprot:TRINITY_DN18102_c0_g1_i1.p2 TRINITY_DN18102_c0_g1~~TRINITY_DN18102_c0_g1_i1.p2  ORF type:complete len:444 (+),score=80.77 TRINITY_DN18102_c0_g1_i1:581-1912(+)